ncbi:MAG TPA: adenylate/guanylate cyclase domain-containing protein [Gaiellaceae bacterium]|nr:adenylate/guanylate cyclase domain-containing protein [Gaiellaceae bacterium]
MDHELPTGSVTLLFTDVEGSTRLLNELGAEAYEEALAEHRRLLREAFVRCGGVEVDTQGDAFFYAFSSAAEAIEAADEGQEALSVGPIRVRMGVHTGRPHVGREGYVGEDVHLAARIAAAGHGGQVLVSQATHALVEGELADLGEHRVKDFSEPVWIFQLGTERFPPLKTISNTNLPRPASSFVGREREVSDLVELLQDGARLVTLSGPGGSGKTRLAIESAAELVPEFRNGVFWIGLAALRDPALVVETVAQTLGAKGGLAEHIGERELLLLLDNFEQVVEAASELASLLESCPNLRLLVTSRELLRIRGEVEHPVSPLAQPEAVELFCARSRLEQSEEIAELCRRLDNLPLAVELAAARTSVLSPAQILERLSQRLDLLKGGRDSEARQQTLRATIEWSYGLLGEEERRLFARLSVFAGGCTLEAAAVVADADLDTLQSLVDQSLLRHAGERFWMLETIREFALERLEETGGAADLRHRHSAYLLELGELAKPELKGGPRSSIWFDRLEAEHDNIRAALGDALEHGRADVALRLGGSVWLFWLTRGYWSEGRRWLESALATSMESDPRLRFDALWGAGLLAVWQGDLERGRAAADALLALAAETDSTRARAVGVNTAGLVAIKRGDWNSAAHLHAESAGLARELGDSWLLSIAVNNLGFVALSRGEYERARELFEESLSIGRELQDQDLLSRAFTNLGFTTLMLGDVERARSLLRDALIAGREIGHVEGFTYGFVGLGAAYAREDPARAARLIGRADMLCEETASDLAQFEGRVRDEAEAELRAELGEDAYAAVYAEGRALALEDALALALRPD